MQIAPQSKILRANDHDVAVVIPIFWKIVNWSTVILTYTMKNDINEAGAEYSERR